MFKKIFSFSIYRDLGLQILMLYTLFVVPVVVSALIFDNYASEELEREIMAADVALAQAIAQETDTTIRNSLWAVDRLAASPPVTEADGEAMEAIFSQVAMVRPEVNLIYRLDSTGLMLFHYPVGPTSTVGVDFSFRVYFQRALTTKSALVSLGRISPTTSQPVATAVMPIWDGDEFLGVVATNIRLESLSETLTSISEKYDQAEGFEVVILDAAGKVIASPYQANLLTDYTWLLPNLTESVLQGESGNYIGQGSDGEERLYSYVPVEDVRWGVIVSRPTAVAYATINGFHNGVMMTIAMFLIIGIFFWIALALRVIRPLERLAAYSQSIGANKEMTEDEIQEVMRFSNRPDQIGHLVRSFHRMNQSIQARIKELATLVETGAEVVSTLDSEIVLDRILAQVEKLLGINKSVIIALDEKQGVFKARASRGISKRYAEELVISPDEPTSITMRAIRMGAPIQVRDTEKDPSFHALRPRARAEGYRSFVSIPLRTTHAPPSALVVYSPEPQVFNKPEMNLLSSFANQAAMAIENAALFARSDTQLQEQTRRLEAMIQSLDVGLILENLEGKVLYANRMVAELSELPLEDIVGTQVRTLFEKIANHAKDKAAAAVLLDQVISEGVGVNSTLALGYRNKVRHIQLEGFTVNDADGVLIGWGQILQDITKNYELDRMKSTLISTVSHELRTPLAAIKGYATTLLADDVDWETKAQKEFLEIISSETDRLSNLVNNLLDMSRIEAGSLRLSRTAYSVHEVVEQGITQVIIDSNGQLVIDIPEDLPLVYVDLQRIGLVLRNLVENAVKYSEDGLPIRVFARAVDDKINLYVEDQGTGIPKDKQDAVFDSFYQLDNGVARTQSGVGLGLAICRGFVNAHGGEIWIEPREVGTCLAFSLPIMKE